MERPCYVIHPIRRGTRRRKAGAQGRSMKRSYGLPLRRDAT